MSKQHAALEPMPQRYNEWLKYLKQRIHTAFLVPRQSWIFGNYFCVGADLSAQGEWIRPYNPSKQDWLSNLKYMRAFAEALPDAEFVQQAVAQLPWHHHITLLKL